MITLWASGPVLVRGVPLSPQHYVNRQLKPSRLTLLRNFLIARVFAEYMLSVVMRIIDSVSLTSQTRVVINLWEPGTISSGNACLPENAIDTVTSSFESPWLLTSHIITIIDTHSLLSELIARCRRNKKIFTTSRVIMTHLLWDSHSYSYNCGFPSLSSSFKLSHISEITLIEPLSFDFLDFCCLPFGTVAQVDTWR